MKKYVTAGIIAAFIMACSLFDTRNPEEPSEDNGTFVPPSTPGIVIENVVNAFENKNVNNYAACFSNAKFKFTPSVEVAARYPSLFENWTVDSEKQCFTNAIAAMNKESKPILSILNRDFDFISQDSAVLVSEYIINCEFLNASISKNFTGKAIFTIMPETDGLWRIAAWQDFQLAGDTNKDSWSSLKAYFRN